MTDPIDLNARRETRIPQPDGDPLIVMPMDSNQIIFRDQAALDDYVAGALGDLKARNAESYEDGYNQGHADAHADGAAPDRLCALRAELDNLRDRLNALAASYDDIPAAEVFMPSEVRQLVQELRAMVRGSDDE